MRDREKVYVSSNGADMTKTQAVSVGPHYTGFEALKDMAKVLGVVLGGLVVGLVVAWLYGILPDLISTIFALK